VANQQVFKEKLADFRVHQQIWTPPSWRVLRGVGWFSNVPADLDWAHTWRVLESFTVKAMKKSPAVKAKSRKR
jgi:hypothetical protein